MAQKKNSPRKYLALPLVFVLICMIFVARLVNLQFNREKTAQLRTQSEYTVETQVIQALRGNICDRYGNVLVTTSYAYDIIFDYNDMPSNFRYTKTLDELLSENNIPGIHGVDTRKLARRIRDKGICKVLITDAQTGIDDAIEVLRDNN